MVVIAATALAISLAWAWLLRAPMPAMRVDPWSAAYLVPAFAMWALMMVAMMLPSALPMILLHARVARQGRPGALPPSSLAFALAYLALWTAFALGAALAQAALVAGGAAEEMSLALGGAVPAAMLLALAAAYQLSPLKRACLEQCRSPLSFVMRGFRPGPSASVRLGLAHGAYCIGCCWALMALLFVGGVMNLAWVGALTAVVIAEKYGPRWANAAIAGLLAAAAAAILLLGG